MANGRRPGTRVRDRRRLDEPAAGRVVRRRAGRGSRRRARVPLGSIQRMGGMSAAAAAGGIAMPCSLGGHVWPVAVASRYRCAARAIRRLHPVTTEARAPSTRQVPSPRSTLLRAAYAFGITDERTVAARTWWCSWAVVLRGHAQAKRRMAASTATSSAVATPRPRPGRVQRGGGRRSTFAAGPRRAHDDRRRPATTRRPR